MEPFKSQDGDKSTTCREAEQYADDLARELIDDTDSLVRAEHSQAEAEVMQEGQDLLGDVSGGNIELATDGQNSPSSTSAQQFNTLVDKPKRPSVVVAQTALYFDQDSLDESSAPEQPNRRPDEDLETRAKQEPQPKEHEDLPEGDQSSLFKSNDQTYLFHQTFKTAANTSQLSNDDQTDAMEFTKNYSDDLLMGQRSSSGGADSATSGTGGNGPDLADFELPTYSGSSSSGSEQATTLSKQQSPAKQKKSSSAGLQASSSQTGVATPDLTAVRNVIVSTYSRVSHVFHWKRPVETGALFASGMTIIIALTFFSIISVVAYSALGIILASALIRIFKTSMKALNRPSETPFDHIWEKVLDLDVSLSPEKMHKLVEASHVNLNASLVYFKQVLLVEDKFATLKFGFFLYLLTYIGAWFNGLTLITICYLSLFSVPLFYEKNKAKIDEYLNMATNQIYSTITTATNKVTALARGATKANETKKQN